ncbi:hypothetical protein ACN265_32230 [Micromonospora sp. WMMD730]|uniref:hypothetical protein n=1 Tax=Micromonospora sp. WMMD730 TaxID=3404128 RepID=UPI003B9311A2
MIPAAVTRTVVTTELPAVQAWAARRPGWAVHLDDTALMLIVNAVHPRSGSALRITAQLSGYPAVPPAWRFTDPAGGSAPPFPQAGTNAEIVPGSIFHGNRVICAPWNQLAYAEHNGPHGDWGGLTNWKNAGAGSTKADTLADMLSQIHLHLTLSPGMS